MKKKATGPQRTGPGPLGVHPLVEADKRPDKSTASAPEAAEWLKNPTAIVSIADQIDEWIRMYEKDPLNCPPLFEYDPKYDDDPEDEEAEA